MNEEIDAGERASHSEIIVSPNETVMDMSLSTGDTTRDTRWTRLVALVRAHTRAVVLIGLGGLFVFVGLAFYFYSTHTESTPPKHFANIYTFVPEKISMSAMIPLSLPKGISEAEAIQKVVFSPALKGEWIEDAIPEQVTFKPDTELLLGTYYAVTLDTGTVRVSGDFLVDANPRVETVFPREGSETDEHAKITILFNRPMVPLTTLTEQESKELPITISPETKGRFKWVSTRNLQFIPDTQLTPSSHYTVAIGEGMTSIDGLSVAPETYSFTTRPLRYVSVSESGVGYRSPIVIAFNQPVDLEKTEGMIRVTNGNGDTVDVNVEYGETTTYDRVTGDASTHEDRSTVFVYQKKDAYGRKNVWDFETNYTFSITGAVPSEGDITLDEERTVSVQIPHIVADVAATSERSPLASPDLFDPQGTLVVRFHDDIDKDRSKIHAKGLRSMVYGEQCKRDARGEEIFLGDDCEKEEDPRTLVLTFDPTAFSPSEVFSLTFDALYTRDGFLANKDAITRDIRVYPTLSILRTVPAEGTQNAALDRLTLCTNAPLREPGDAGMKSYVRTENYIVYGRWSDSFLVHPYEKNEYYRSVCSPGEYETEIQYGLLPTTPYTLSLALTDAFEGTTNGHLSFTTTEPGEQYTRFHNMQKQYNVTRPEHTQLTYAVENLEYVDMHICKLPAASFLERLNQGGNRAPSGVGCTEVQTERITLPPRYWVNNYFQVDLHTYFADTRGQYVLTFSSPLYRDSYSKEQLYDVTYLSVTGLAVGKKEVRYEENEYYWGSGNPLANEVLKKKLGSSQNLYWVNDSATLAAVSGATVVQYHGDIYPKSGAIGMTNGEGIARVATERNVNAAIVSYNGDVAIVSDWADTLGWYAQNADNSSRTYLYTDRPIYRPGHTVYIRGIDRVGFDGAYEVWQQNNVPLEVFDATGNRVYDTMLTVNPYGTFNTEFTLPADAPLGSYRIDVFNQSAWFDVEEYVPAPFKLELTGGKEEYTNGEEIQLDVQADYYFGVPLSGGEVFYSATAQDYYFDRYTDEYFNFGSGWYSCYSCGYGDKFLFRGEAVIDEQGSAHISRPIHLKDFFKDDESVGSKLVTFTVSAKDTNGRSVSAQRTFIVHKGAFYIGAVTSEYYTGVNTPITLKVKTVDTKGTPISERDIQRVVYKVDWDIFKRQEVDGGFYYRSEKKRTQMSEETIKTDGNGNWEGTLTFPKEGEYEIVVSKDDAEGNRIDTTTSVYIYGESVVVPPNNNYDLDIEVMSNDMKVGEKGSLLIKSPYKRAKMLITAERGTIFDYWIREVSGGLFLHEFPVKSEYVPNVYFSALLLSDTPEVKYGTAEFAINKDEHVLDVEVTANKTSYLPGEQVTLDVVTKSSIGNAVPAEVSIAVADLSVLALKGNPKRDPLSYFYSGFPLSVVTGSNIKNILYEMDIPLGTKGGGGDPNDLVTKKRGLFKDTAYWSASVTTDTNGHAQVSFTLPDNLTTWQIESIGVTKDTKVGVDYTELTTKKDLMAVPLAPRFIVPGDTFKLGAKVFNETEKSAQVAVALTSDTLTFIGEHTDTVTVEKGETKTVYFDVTAPKDKKSGEHLFTFKASFDAYVDEVERAIPITKNRTYETVATVGVTTDRVTTEYLYVPEEVLGGDGGLTVHANATLAAFMTDALTYMATYPYGCSEQLASALSTIAILQSALKTPNVPGRFETIEYEGVTYTVDEVVHKGLTKIYETQTMDGGFSYYTGLMPDVWLSMHVLTALTELKQAGFSVREDVLSRGATYIEAKVSENYGYYPREHRELVILAEYALRQVNGNTPTHLTSLVTEILKEKLFVQEEMSSMTLAYLAILTAKGWDEGVRAYVYDTLLNRINIDGRGAYLKPSVQQISEYYETAIKDTALLLKAFVAHEDKNTQIASLLRWLLASRDAHGVWGSTQNTFVVVDAMAEYLAFTHETEAQFTLEGALGGTTLFEHAWSGANIFETLTHTTPIDSFARNTLLPFTFTRTDSEGQKNTLYYDMSLKYFLPVESLPPRDEGITITRDIYTLTDTEEKTPIEKAKIGDIVKGKITLTVPGAYTHVSVEDFIPAGFEIVNQNLDTEQGAVSAEKGDYGFAPVTHEEERGYLARAFSRVGTYFGYTSQTAQTYSAMDYTYSYDVEEGTKTLYPSHIEAHDDRVFLYTEALNPGVYEYEYYLRALVPGTFTHLPARAEELYFPDIFGRTSGGRFTVTE